MSGRRGIKETLLIGSGAVLVLLIVLLLVSLGGSEPEEPDLQPLPDPAPRVATPAPAAPERPAPVLPAVVKPRPVSPAPAPAPLPPPPRREVARAAVEAPVAVRAPNEGFASAPAAEPPELADEPDPQRRAVLKKMHSMAMARLQVDNFRRRYQLLEQSLAAARASGTWTNEKMDRAELDLQQLKGTIRASEQRFEQLKSAMDRELGSETDLPGGGTGQPEVTP